jgi:hypothetical protein
LDDGTLLKLCSESRSAGLELQNCRIVNQGFSHEGKYRMQLSPRDTGLDNEISKWISAASDFD